MICTKCIINRSELAISISICTVNILWRVCVSEDDNPSSKDDILTQRYDTILKESALLTTFSGILFGFLLNISVNTPYFYDY
jgi:hypothetical protein